jgi:hypothetical protein
MFKAILIEKDEAGYRAGITELADEQLPEGDVTVRVAYSTINYKDGLAITGKVPVVRRFPKRRLLRRRRLGRPGGGQPQPRAGHRLALRRLRAQRLHRRRLHEQLRPR